MRKTMFLLLLVLFATTAFSQDRNVRNYSTAREDGQNVVFNSVINLPPKMNNLLSYPGEIPGTSTFWDYQTNGSSLNVLMVFGDTILFCYGSCDSTDPTGATTRMANLVISVNGGVNWTDPMPVQTLPTRAAYPELRKIYLTGNNPSVMLSGRNYNGSNSRGGAWVDAFFGLGSFSSTYVMQEGRDFFGDLISGSLYGGVFSSPQTTSIDTLFFCKFNYNTNTYTGKTLMAAPPNGISGNVRYRFASNGGSSGVVMWYDNTTAAYAMRYKLTTDGGTTWGSTQAMQVAFGQNGVINGDTCSPWFGIDAAFKPNTTNWGAVFSTLYPTATGQSSGDPQGCKILFYSPTVNGGVPVQAAGKINMNIISDPGLFNTMAALQVGVTPVSHPSIAYSSDGSRIVIAFSGYQPGDSLDGFNYNDIYITYSDNGGLNWAAPVNLTNTHTWDELYPVLSETGNTSGQFTVKYQVTKGPGAQSFNNNAPTYRVYHVLKKFNPANIGVREVNNTVPSKFSLNQNYPNPFNPTTTIRFDVPKSSFVTLNVYDITGKLVETLVEENLSAGSKEVSFNASRLSSGVYFYKLTADNFQSTKKMILVK